MKITKDTTIGEIMHAYPELAMVLLEHGLHCVGCHAAQDETLGQGCAVHGMDGEQINKLIGKLNKEAKEIEAGK